MFNSKEVEATYTLAKLAADKRVPTKQLYDLVTLARTDTLDELIMHIKIKKSKDRLDPVFAEQLEIDLRQMSSNDPREKVKRASFIKHIAQFAEGERAKEPQGNSPQGQGKSGPSQWRSR